MHAVQSRNDAISTFKQGIEMKNPVGIKFSSFNRDQSIQQLQLSILKQNSTRKLKDLCTLSL
jgi:hypothetical protein